MRIHIERLDTQLQTGKVRRHAEGCAAGGFEGKVAAGQRDDIVEHTRARREFGLPGIADVSSDRPSGVGRADIVGVDYTGNRHAQQVADGDAARSRGIWIREGQSTRRNRVEAGGQLTRLVGKLQSLDMRQMIDAITTSDIVGDRDNVISKIGRRAAVIDDDRIVGKVALEDRGIEVVGSARSIRRAVDDFADRHELAGIIGAVEHQRDQWREAIVGRNFGPGAIEVGAHANADVEGRIAVDQVVAAETQNNVAAVAAEDNVTGAETGNRDTHRVVKQFLQTVDARYARCVEGPGLGIESRNFDRVSVAAADVIGESGARDALDLGKAVENGGRRGRDRRLIKGGQLEVDRNADSILLIRDPVEARHAVHLVLGITADEDVVAAFADHFVEAAAADKDVVAGHVIEATWIEVVARRSVLGTQLDPVVTFVAGFGQVRLGAIDEIVALTAENGRDVVPSGDEVLAVATQKDVGELGASDRVRIDQNVVAGVAVHDGDAAHVGDDIVA